MTPYRPNMIEGGNHIGMAEELDSDEILQLQTDDYLTHQSPYTIELWRNRRTLQV
jgi:hypothetical protein